MVTKRTRFHHRIKTHGRWSLKQPEPGVYLWRTPHLRYYLVDATGTHPLPRTIGEATWNAHATGIDLHPAHQAIDYTPAA